MFLWNDKIIFKMFFDILSINLSISISKVEKFMIEFLD